MVHRTSTPALHVEISCWNRPKNARSCGTKRSFIMFNLLITWRDQIVLPRLMVPSGRWPTHGEGARNQMPCNFSLRRLAAKVKEAIRNPPRDAMLSHAGTVIGPGWAFALREAPDQTGALLGPLPPSERRLAAETAAKLAEALVYVAVIGEFKRGKSTLINALLGEDVLPTGITPVTAVPTLVRFGPAARAVSHRTDGSAAPLPLAQLPDYVTERRNPGNRKHLREVVVEHAAPLLASGLVLADTPGTGSVHRHNTETTTAFFPVSTSPCWCSPSTRRSRRPRPACWPRWAGRPRGWRSASTRRTC